MSLTGLAPARPAEAEEGPTGPDTGTMCAGLDWAKDDHVLCLVDADGEVVDRFNFEHTAAGIRNLVRTVLAADLAGLGIERSDGPLVEALLSAGITVFVIPPSQIKNLRSRYGSAGNKDDRFDAYVLADTVRTDRRRLTPLTLSTPPTRALRAAVRARRNLVTARVAAANQLRAHLQTALPGAVGLFTDLDSAISLSFLEQYPTQSKVDWLTPTRLGNWLAKVGYPGGIPAEKLHARLRQAPAGITDPALAQIHATITASFVQVLRTLNEQIRALEKSIATQLLDHPDAAVLTSLPRAGTVRAARLLAEIGDARGRFPTAQSLAALAGVAPSTRQSGKTRTVAFRWNADTQLRDALCDFAADSRKVNPWAAEIYNQARARRHDHPHAVRILARAWTGVIWRCWQDHQPYDPDKHQALQRLLNTQEA